MMGAPILPDVIASSDLVVAVDVGTGTQDIVLRVAGVGMENCPSMVLPAPTVLKAREIAAVTARGETLFLDGRLMGGGPVARALRHHLKAGLPASATPSAAKTFKDDLETVRSWGVTITGTQPPGSVRVVLGDIDAEGMDRLFAPLALPPIGGYAVAVQDHGESIGESNRLFRFKLWKRFLEEEEGLLWKAVWQAPPAHYTRMRSVSEALPGAVVCDTGMAAILGALYDDQVRAAARSTGAIIVNVGNGHTLGIALLGDRVAGLFEHHTGMLDGAQISRLVEQLRGGAITHAEVFEGGGHGAALAPAIRDASFPLIALTGPRWDLAEGLGYFRVAPFGSMMLTGSYGLLAAWDRVVGGVEDPWEGVRSDAGMKD
jgi:uncharacterized protein (DUF1786 family)